MEVFDPGLLLEGLAAYDAFDRIMWTGLVSKFWDSVHPDDPRLLYLMTETPDIWSSPNSEAGATV